MPPGNATQNLELEIVHEHSEERTGTPTVTHPVDAGFSMFNIHETR